MQGYSRKVNANLFEFFLLILFPLALSGKQDVSCSLEQGSEEVVMSVNSEANALGGQWKAMAMFRVRALLAVPALKNPWLLVEVYVEAVDEDYRIISSQKVFEPFSTGRMEVVEPRLGRSLRYECREVK